MCVVQNQYIHMFNKIVLLLKKKKHNTIYQMGQSKCEKNIELAKKFVWDFLYILWKNPNEIFGQPNTREINQTVATYA